MNKEYISDRIFNILENEVDLDVLTEVMEVLQSLPLEVKGTSVASSNEEVHDILNSVSCVSESSRREDV